MKTVKGALYVKLMNDFGDKYGKHTKALVSLPSAAMKAATMVLLSDVIKSYNNGNVLVWTNNGEEPHLVNFQMEDGNWIASENGQRIASLEELWLDYAA